MSAIKTRTRFRRGEASFYHEATFGRPFWLELLSVAPFGFTSSPITTLLWTHKAFVTFPERGALAFAGQ
jgi:hypothetical protein